MEAGSAAEPTACFNVPTLAALLQGQDLVINLVAVLQGNAARFQHVHVDLPAKLAAACMRTGVRRVVHVSALGVSADAPSMYLRSKAAGEAVLQAAGLDLTLLRPSVIFGAGDSFLNLFARLQAVAPVMPLIGFTVILPHNLSQISERISSRMGDLKPAAPIISDIF